MAPGTGGPKVTSEPGAGGVMTPAAIAGWAAGAGCAAVGPSMTTVCASADCRARPHWTQKCTCSGLAALQVGQIIHRDLCEPIQSDSNRYIMMPGPRAC